MKQPTGYRILEHLADHHLGFPTLESRNMDSLDFHEVAVWEVREALIAAFEEGRRFEARVYREARAQAEVQR